MSYRSEPCSDQTRRWFLILKCSKFNCVWAGDWNLFIYCLTLSNGGCCSVPADRIVLVVGVVQGIVGNRQPQTTPLCYSHSTGGWMSSVSALWIPTNQQQEKQEESVTFATLKGRHLRALRAQLISKQIAIISTEKTNSASRGEERRRPRQEGTMSHYHLTARLDPPRAFWRQRRAWSVPAAIESQATTRGRTHTSLFGTGASRDPQWQ